MKIATIRAFDGMDHPSVSNKKAAQGTFRTVLSNVSSSNQTSTVLPSQSNKKFKSTDKEIVSIIGAKTFEELKATVKEITGDETKISILENNLGDLGQIAEQLNIAPAQLLDSLLSFLEKAGLRESDLAEITNTDDIWAVLDKIDKVAPQFFNQLAEALEGKGEIPNQHAVGLLAFLKTIELIAPKSDLLMMQEQQVFGLQGFLKAVSERLEDTFKSSITTKMGMVQLMEQRREVGVLVQIDSGQNTNEDGKSKSGTELAQQAISGHTGNAIVFKGEVTAAELESRNNTRNETLLREMQTILKRSNFGQTGGTNRLLIKLYPEQLGQLRIELLQNNGVMTARILASTSLGKEMLDSQLNQLRSAFQQQNLQVERIDITQTLQDTNRNDRNQSFNQQNAQQHLMDEQPEQHTEEEMTFQEYMIELEA
ncbi:flagellar hook-length control protein FliK [Filibacter tadaridae]|uniref:Flagellar hook-length control protein FliK n=1 Tax=Filibacter tadaridae TaxID=2483811 RepID=A0A3P5X450_9BACL|nr:flagellar hook-length control protein FliK [Filibacter tadaridae]VDC29754.1 Flagellar hook-length control protein FliK [Filibacter tadaridae]